MKGLTLHHSFSKYIWALLLMAALTSALSRPAWAECSGITLAQDDFECGHAGCNPFTWGNVGWSSGNSSISGSGNPHGTGGHSLKMDESNPISQRLVSNSINAQNVIIQFWFNPSSVDSTDEAVNVFVNGSEICSVAHNGFSGTPAPLFSAAAGQWGFASCPAAISSGGTTFLLEFQGPNLRGNDAYLIDDVEICAPVIQVGIHGIRYHDGDSIIVYEDESLPVDITLLPPGTIAVALSSSLLGSVSASSTSVVLNAEGHGQVTLKGAPSFTGTTGTVTFSHPKAPPITLHVKALKRAPISGEGFRTPTFFMTAANDWLHNFYDSNLSSGKSTPSPVDDYDDPDTDNFNKIILMDSNLFPIHTALGGELEMPNIMMRNWTTGIRGQSPSVNDYMNRSVAAVANYIPATTAIPLAYGSHRELKAIGMRDHLEWVYVVDPANHNVRRYKFVKTNDTLPGDPYWDASYNKDTKGYYQDESTNPGFGGAISPTASKPEANCPSCDPNYWYVVDYTQSLDAYNGQCPLRYYDADRDGQADIKFAMYARHQNPSVPVSSPPVLRYQYPIPARTVKAGNPIDVSMLLRAFKTNDDAELSFTLNNQPSSLPSSCIKSSSANSLSPAYTLSSVGGCEPKRTQCRPYVHVNFPKVPVSCAQNCNSRYCYMTIDMQPKLGGWFVELSKEWTPRTTDGTTARTTDSIPLAGFEQITNELAVLSPARRRKVIESRWANISAYLDLIPPQSYPGYPTYTAVNLAQRRIGYGFQTNTTFTNADYVRFKNPRDIDVYRDYFDDQNGGPVYIFVADTMNSRIQVFMNATASAGDVGATFPLRPVPVKAPNDSSSTAYRSNELAVRPASGFGQGRPADWRSYTTLPGNSFVNITAGKGEFFYPHGIAVDQDPDSKDVYLFVADTYNHRIQVFRDLSGVSSQAIDAKQFDFEYVGGWGTYPLQTTMSVTPPGPYNFRYPKGIDIARFKNNSSYLYVVDSKNYRLMKYLIGDAAAASGSTITVSAKAGYGYDGSAFVSNLHQAGNLGVPLKASGTTPGFLDPQDVATGYSGFFLYTSPFGEGTQFLNNYMVYVSDYARNNTSAQPMNSTSTRDRLNMRVMQFIQIPASYSNISGNWIPWATEQVPFGSYTSTSPAGNLTLGQSVFGASNGVYNSTGDTNRGIASTNNVPGVAQVYTDRPFGVAALQWNTVKPIDIRVVNADGSDAAGLSSPITSYPPGTALPLNSALRIGVSSRYLSFGYPESMKDSFWNFSSEKSAFWNVSTAPSPSVGRWDGIKAGRVHIFCYGSAGAFQGHTALSEAPYSVTLSAFGCSRGGLAKIVAEDNDFAYSGRTGTLFYTIGK
ncbi:hypothetical protein CSB45_04430 [candidate division KSB3 bacterium]|uniref:Uncharacterized protein n=1 Tax=candidate division KSB3 bacterium TaxID=2044937 RepID=A0A2G6E887_9BACT|nr:MAG: hypothetical protein CSB45_04430 [candidate division KSB3 bacterium]PIE30624.1 MAG: hypothetical protein CSA57_03015 [candidate division KSB3 bacterium]